MRHPLDLWLLDQFAAWQSAPLDIFFIACTWLGSLWVLVPFAVWLAWRTRQGLVLLALLVAATASHLLKVAIGRVRPDVHEALVMMPGDASFPSAHSAQAAACAMALALVFPACRRPPALMLLAGWLGIVGISRLHLQVHWPSDVLAGWLLGGCAALVAWRLQRFCWSKVR